MKKRAWQKKITGACQEAGTYKPYFDFIIEELAEILEKRDEISKEYKESEEGPTISYTNKNGATNITKNPLLVMWDDLNKSALSHWRDLGLTPAGLQKIRGTNFQVVPAGTEANDLLGKLRRKKEENGTV